MSVNMMPLALPQANCMLLLSCLPLALWTGVPVILDHQLFPLVFAYVRKRQSQEKYYFLKAIELSHLAQSLNMVRRTREDEQGSAGQASDLTPVGNQLYHNN